MSFKARNQNVECKKKQADTGTYVQDVKYREKYRKNGTYVQASNTGEGPETRQRKKGQEEQKQG